MPAERDMAEMFGISRQSVREALRGLEMSGLVESRPGVTGGVFIREGDPSVVTRAVNDLVSLGALSSESLFEARVMLTTDVIRLAAIRATEEDLQKMEDDIVAFDQQATPIPGEQRTVRVTNFYSLLAAASHNEVLVMLMNSLTEIVQARLNKFGPDPLTDVTRMRRRFVKHLRAGDVDKASSDMEAHLKRVENRLAEKEKKALAN
ncbi:FadR/GntR family transcriptional regulator [Citricoccus parietis]|uniref:FadR/GntR family transcriptional regulator n=1 Tax=Citricoccus parietis TaxID=592307 RepID=A0ABV5G3E7_9MICC